MDQKEVEEEEEAGSDVEWYRQEVGEEPDEQFMRNIKAKKDRQKVYEKEKQQHQMERKTKAQTRQEDAAEAGPQFRKGRALGGDKRLRQGQAGRQAGKGKGKGGGLDEWGGAEFNADHKRGASGGTGQKRKGGEPAQLAKGAKAKKQKGSKYR
uniref:Uncharacterized protein n=1 Tax=Pyramimonas obovata TaxID=1411642 RepID=A0A7S0WM54_9CHLO